MKCKQFLKYLFFLVLMVSLGFLYGFSSHRNQQKKIKTIVVEFEEDERIFLSDSMVNKLLIQNSATVKNQAKSVINLYELENRVSKNSYVEKASVFLTIEGALKSIIKQRVPVARIILNTTSYYIDKEGVKIPLSANFSARVPLITGLKSDENKEEIVGLMQIILADNFLQKEIVGIHKLANGEYQFSVRSGNYKIDFGKLTNIDVKFKKLKAFYNKTFLDKTIENYKTITLKYHNQVVCTK